MCIYIPHISHVSWRFTILLSEIERQLVKGASGCRYQSIFDLTHPPNVCMKCEIDHHTGNFIPYSFRQRQHILLSYFKTLSVGPVWGSNPRPPAQQTGALPTELTRRRISPTFVLCLGLFSSSKPSVNLWRATGVYVYFV